MRTIGFGTVQCFGIPIMHKVFSIVHSRARLNTEVTITFDNHTAFIRIRLSIGTFFWKEAYQNLKVELTGSDYVLTWLLEFPKKTTGFWEKIRNLVPISRIMLRCIYGCQKWIPDKILHRNDDPIFSQFLFFSLKKYFWK